MDIKGIQVEVVRKPIKHVHVGVYPPNGRVRVSAPLKMTDEAVKLFTISKIRWIERQQAKFNEQERQSKRAFVSGESHYLWGNRYRLNIIPATSTQKIELKKKAFIDFYVSSEADVIMREELMDRFYRAELKKQINILVAKWKKITKIPVRNVHVKKMKTRWGTCNQKRGTIWINLELAKKPTCCLEYVLVHELIHILEKNHTEQFNKLMTTFMPQWRQVKEELRQHPLGHNDWTPSFQKA